MEIRHVYWFAYFNLEEPSVRYRAKFPLQQLLEKHRITYSFVYPGYDLKSIFGFIRTYLSALLFRKRNSLIVFQKLHTNGIYANALKLLLFFRRQHTLYDIDDAEHTRRPVNTIHYFMKRCSVVSAGSTALIEYTRQFNNNVFLLTSPVPDHGIVKAGRGASLTIGWIGYYGAHRKCLTRLFFPALLEVDFPVTLKILGVSATSQVAEISDYFSSNKNITIDASPGINWHDEASVYERISTFDIGVAPLSDTEFNRGKSAFKLKQCLSCGVPVLASAVGENKRFLKDQVNGYLCKEPSDFLAKIVKIKNSGEAHYRQLSAHARTSYPTFSMDHYCETLLSYFRA